MPDEPIGRPIKVISLQSQALDGQVGEEESAAVAN
jgi:hypothetical protein